MYASRLAANGKCYFHRVTTSQQRGREQGEMTSGVEWSGAKGLSPPLLLSGSRSGGVESPSEPSPRPLSQYCSVKEFLA